ncbi:hypothetical protein JMN32_26940 [Fulvivirga sp. 29W222]|uniref:SPOR domain-containing protein n=1 Tax=Fulvivirga marina TaxID=2494733 RepID=A0A937G1A1_9BACT|nr:hypothetical protein [Fulvivirga marina]MBL6449979.1 hypothetical protein [Fulvivirga marina]
MAKKDKNDEIEDNDNINRDSNDDFNEADDSFGLPDVDYEPLDRDEDIQDDSSQEDQSSTIEPEPEPEHTETEDAYTQEEESDVYASSSEEPHVEEESTYVPGSYTPPKDNSMLPKILGLVFVLLLAGAAIWWFGFHQPAIEAEQRAKLEQQKRIEEQKQREEEAQRERERLERERAQREEEARLAAQEAEPKIGTIETISSRTGRYYVVIASAIDEDLAMDHAKKLSNEGANISIIKPFGSSKFHRIAVESHDTWAGAEASATDLRGQYGDDVWVIKY